MCTTGSRSLRVAVLTACVLGGATYPCMADLVSTGDLAFIGFNADGNDDFAIVLLADAAVGNVVHFNDNEWVGTQFNATNEGEISWTVTTALSAGTVVTFSNLGTAPTASSGTLSGGLMALSANEAIYAFTGANATTPTTFLAAFSNDEQIFDGPLGSLSGTGLTQGTTAVLIPRNVNDPIDGGQYAGPRSGQAAFSDYLSLINDINANWDIDYTDGAQFVPFNSTAFTTSMASTPEPPGLALAAVGLVPAVVLRKRRRRNAFPHGFSGSLV